MSLSSEVSRKHAKHQEVRIIHQMNVDSLKVLEHKVHYDETD